MISMREWKDLLPYCEVILACQLLRSLLLLALVMFDRLSSNPIRFTATPQAPKISQLPTSRAKNKDTRIGHGEERPFRFVCERRPLMGLIALAARVVRAKRVAVVDVPSNLKC